MKKKILEALGVALITTLVFISCRTQDESLGGLEMNPNEDVYALEESSDRSGPAEVKETAEEKETVEEATLLMVHVCGAVQAPGVYSLPVGSRLFEATAMAGGLAENADTDEINLARELRDGEQIRIPYFGEEEAEGGLININQADAETLCRIPGVGEAKADAIVEYRQNNGPFGTVEELMQISGIKEGLLDKMSPYITCE